MANLGVDLTVVMAQRIPPTLSVSLPELRTPESLEFIHCGIVVVYSAARVLCFHSAHFLAIARRAALRPAPSPKTNPTQYHVPHALRNRLPSIHPIFLLVPLYCNLVPSSASVVLAVGFYASGSRLFLRVFASVSLCILLSKYNLLTGPARGGQFVPPLCAALASCLPNTSLSASDEERKAITMKKILFYFFEHYSKKLFYIDLVP